MRFALVNEIRTEPYPGLAGTCNFCGRAMIPKCGRYVRWHWAHKRRSGCDPWHEAETDWHLMWKDCFPQYFQERVNVDERTGERHIADVKADNGLVVEIQHSPISESEMQSREDFYGDMIWIVDARDLSGYFALGTSYDLATCNPMSYDQRQIEFPQRRLEIPTQGLIKKGLSLGYGSKPTRLQTKKVQMAARICSLRGGRRDIRSGGWGKVALG